MSNSYAEQVRSAWAKKDENALLNLLRLDNGNDWRTIAVDFLAVMVEVDAPVLDVLNLGCRVEVELRTRRRPTYALLWRLFAVPRILYLEQGATFDDLDLVAYTAGAALPNLWLPATDWVAAWCDDVVAKYAGMSRPFDLTKQDDFGLTRLQGFGTNTGARPPIFHPLLLGGLITALTGEKGFNVRNNIASVICRWLTDQAVLRGTASATVNTAFAAGAAVLAIASKRGAKITPDAVTGLAPWSGYAGKTLDAVIRLAQASPTLAVDVQGSAAHITRLLEEGPTWHTAPVVDVLRARASGSLQESLVSINQTLRTLDTYLTVDVFAPTLDAVAPVALPDRRAAVDPKAPAYTDPTYLRLLDDVDQAKTVVERQQMLLQLWVVGAHSQYTRLSHALASPLLPAALVELQQTYASDNHRLVRTLLHRQGLARLPLRSRFYRSAVSLPESAEWQKIVNAAAPGGNDPAALDTVLSAWGELDRWEGWRGAGEELFGAKHIELVDTNPWQRLPPWLIGSEQPPSKWDDVGLLPLRADLAAITLLGQPSSAVEQLRTGLQGLLKSDLPQVWRTTFAAAWLDLGITLATKNAPALALPQLAQIDERLSELKQYIEWALGAQDAWASRAGMQGLILLARMAQLTDDIRLTAAAVQLAANRAGAVSLHSLEWLLAGSTTTGSALPLAYIAADLLRYHRGRSAAVTAALLEPRPTWLPAQMGVGRLLSQLADRFASAPRTCLAPFVDDLPARCLLLTVQRIQLDQFQRERLVVVRPATQAEVQPLLTLRGAVRALYAGDSVVQNSIPSADVALAPWWNTTYWSGAPFDDGTLTAPGDTATLQLLNWIDTAAGNAAASLLAEAGALDAATPPLPPAPPPPSSSLVIRYSDSWLWDVDGRYEGEFPEISWKAARERLMAAQKILVDAEGRYETALGKRADSAWKAKVQQLLSQPLLLNTADFRAQIAAAAADLEEAEADLAAAQHESLAAEFEKHAAGLIYEAAKLELSRQAVLEQVTELDQQVAALEQEIGALVTKRAEVGVDQAEIDVAIASKRIKQAELELEKASLAKNSILEEIETLRRILGAPLKSDGTPDDPEGRYQIQVPVAGGVTRSANGQIAAMAISLEGTIGQKLAQNLDEARKELAEEERKERKRKKKSFWGKIVKAVCKVVGTVVGAVLGGPAGAALGGAIGEALGEIGAGIIEGKSLESIVLGLIDNAFDIAGAAGLNLEAELNKLGSKAMGEIKTVFKTIDAKLAPAFDDLPRIFGEEIFTTTFYQLGIDQEVPELAGLAKKAYAHLRTDLGKLEDRYNEAGGLGTILKGASRFESFDQIRKALSNVLLNDIFAETKKDVQKMAALGKAIGMQVAELTTAEGQEEAVTRFGTLVLSTMVSKSYEGRQQILASWLQNMRDLGLNWSSDEVRKQAKLLLEDLFPNPEVRAQVEGSIRQALADPAVMRGRIHELLQAWQGKLDLHLQDMQKEPAGTDQIRTELDLARVEVKFLEDAQAKFEKNLLPFLKSESGHSDERDVLYRQLDAKQQELEQQNLTIESLALEGEIRNGELDKAKIDVTRAETMLAEARKRQQQNELNVEKSSLLNQAASLAKLTQKNIAGAQQEARKAAEARARAAEARVRAALAAVAARRARLDAATLRGAESAAIRISLAAPPPPLVDLAGAELAQARADHARALDLAFEAYRELLRFYRSILAPANKIAVLARPDALDADNRMLTWGGAFDQWLSLVGERFTAAGIPQQRVPEPITWDLSPAQIAAITSPTGLRVIIGPQEEENPIYFTAESAYSASLPTSVQPVDLPPIWRTLFGNRGLELAAKTLVKAEPRASGPPIRWQIYETQPSATPQEVLIYTDVDGAATPFYIWTLERTEALAFNVRTDDVTKSLQICRNQTLDIRTQARSPLDERFLERIDEKKARTGRMVGLFLTMYDRNSGALLTDSDYSIFAEHLGDVWFSRREVRLYRPRTSAELSGRFHFIDAADRPLDYLKSRVDFASLEGDPDMLSVQGMPLSGTLVIRLLAQGEREFESVKIRLLYKVYE